MKELEMNPYVIQIDKFVNSLEKLSHAFLHLEEQQQILTDEEFQRMRDDMRERVCKGCANRQGCRGMDMLWEVVHTIEN